MLQLSLTVQHSNTEHKLLQLLLYKPHILLFYKAELQSNN